MRVYSGKILTCDREDNVYRYLIEDNGKISYVGNEIPENLVKAEFIDLGEKALIPTFVDTHSHFASYAVLASATILSHAKSNLEIKSILKEANSRIKPKKTIIAFGASPIKVAEGRLITKAELDEVVPDRYILVIASDGHSLIVNSKTLNKLPKELANIRGYNADTGIMRHEAFYKVVDHIPKLLKRLDIVNFMQDAINGLIEKGIGMVDAVSGSGFPGDLDVDLIRWIARGQDNGFQMRIYFQTFETEKVIKRGFPRLGGCFKTALDGSITSRDAAMLKPYEGSDNYGILYYTDEQLYEYLSKAHNLGLQIVMHAIGDAAFAQATRTYKKVIDANPRANHRHGIIHASMITDEGLQICKDYNLQILAQPAFIDMTGEIFQPMYEVLGDRVYEAEPHRRFLKNGIMMSAGSDAPVTLPNPIEWLYKACNNPNIINQMTINEALKICTYNGYYTTFDEDKRGSLEVGKIADMVILSKNPYEVPKEELNTLKVVKTYLGGKEFIAKKKKRIVLTIIKGLLRKDIC